MNFPRIIPDTSRYLSRIGILGAVSVDLSGLNRLIQAHLTHIPFEALDVWGSGAVPSLEVDQLYQKIVVNHRGGYCFELNSLFCALLNALGFEAHLVIASLLDEEGTAAPPAHSAIVCHVDGNKYFADVGFGGPVPFGAMPLQEGIWQDFSLLRENSFYILKSIKAGQERFLLRFRDIPAEPVELIPLNFYISQKPDIHFRHRLLVSQRKPDGSVWSLRGRELRLQSAEQVTVIPVEDMESLRRVLLERFAIDPDLLTLREPE